MQIDWTKARKREREKSRAAKSFFEIWTENLISFPIHFHPLKMRICSTRFSGVEIFNQKRIISKSPFDSWNTFLLPHLKAFLSNSSNGNSEWEIRTHRRTNVGNGVQYRLRIFMGNCMRTRHNSFHCHTHTRIVYSIVFTFW